MKAEQQGQGYYAGDAEGLDADYAWVIRRWVRAPARVRWGDVDYGESIPVAICNTKEDQRIILAALTDHDRLVQALEEIRDNNAFGIWGLREIARAALDAHRKKV